MDIKTIGVIGGGVMGNGIVETCARSGYNVILRDVSEEFTARAIKNIDRSTGFMVTKGKMTQEAKDAIMGRIKTTTKITDLKDVDFVIEAVYENMELKKSIFKEVDGLVRPGVIIASNTSSLPITDMAAVTNRPDKCIGMHFFNPVPIMKLVEIVRGYLTSDETVAVTRELSAKMTKETVLDNKDTPGFIVNRASIPHILESIRIFEEGVASKEDIDKAVKLGMNYPMGPFELMDLLGIDTCVDVFCSLERDLKHEFAFTVGHSLKTLAKAKKLGRKSGEGWYKYEKK
jgi:3-hydroxybutyryl-CoA dehydrogenase